MRRISSAHQSAQRRTSAACCGSALMLGIARNAFSSSTYRSRLTLMKSMTLSMRSPAPLKSGDGRRGADRGDRQLQMKAKTGIAGRDFERAAVRLHDLPACGEIARPGGLVAVGRRIVQLDDEPFAAGREARAHRDRPVR